jgi:CRP-like cAMP-binding protein
VQELRTYLQHFTALPDDAWEALGSLFKPQSLDKGDFFARQGSVENQIGFLLEGIMRACVTDSRGTEYNKTLHVPPCFVGAYSSLTTGSVNQINVQALETCRLLIADYRQVISLYDQYPAIERFARRLAEAFFVEKEKREIELVLLDAEARYSLFREAFPGLENRIAQYHIASCLGITPTQLSRIRARKG